MPAIKVGVFDSGVGGLSVVAAIKKGLPELEVIFKNDHANMPYGTRDVAQIYELIKPIFQEFINEGCQVIVVACNTVTTNLISRLREELSVPMVGIEPMVKPAALATKSGIIAVCATPRTLQSARYQWLKDTYAKGIKVIEPDCRDWALMIESNAVDQQKIKKLINQVCNEGADQIVLGCTHYHWIENLIKEAAAGRADVIQPESAIVERLSSVLEQLA